MSNVMSDVKHHKSRTSLKMSWLLMLISCTHLKVDLTLDSKLLEPLIFFYQKITLEKLRNKKNNVIGLPEYILVMTGILVVPYYARFLCLTK